ncbi:DUF6193 family natural product biosynthesis protein [Streptomyces sp. NPDC057052]|uniref:DUF6193 family natural product biosynthesis protein n=1 Tax=Streptomyces sp. NPDC057052 TaxID=3346010 RepID=UPI003639CA5F
MTDIVVAAWRELLATAGDSTQPGGSPLLSAFTELVQVAHAEPKLHQLFPWTGMWELHFSRCTEFRPTWDIPYIGTLRSGCYYVEGPERSSPRIAETDSAQVAVAMVIE